MLTSWLGRRIKPGTPCFYCLEAPPTSFYQLKVKDVSYQTKHYVVAKTVTTTTSRYSTELPICQQCLSALPAEKARVEKRERISRIAFPIVISLVSILLLAQALPVSEVAKVSPLIFIAVAGLSYLVMQQSNSNQSRWDRHILSKYYKWAREWTEKV